jgi:hypothetical protein
MRSSKNLFISAALALLLNSGLAGAEVSGTVTNKTTNSGSSGDTVALVDIQAGMAVAASTTTDSSGRYTLKTPGMGAYLVRVTHQGASFFIAAPQGETPGDVTVYDVAAKVDGVGVDADMFLIEAAGGMLRIHERILIRNTSLPPKAQFSDKTFEVALPAGAELDMASTSRPGGMSTTTRLVPLAEKGHYTFNTPIQPSQGEKETMFELQYHLAYNGKYIFRPALLTPADHLIVYLPLGMELGSAQGASFQATPEDPKVQTFVARNVTPGQAIAFTVSGEGQMQASSAQSDLSGSARAEDSLPGHDGISASIGAPDRLAQYKGWILGVLALLLAGSLAFLLWRGRARSKSIGISGNERPSSVPQESPRGSPTSHAIIGNVIPAGGSALLDTLKEELFRIEKERLTGNLSEGEYSNIKVGIEAVLKRLMRESGSITEPANKLP